MMTHRQAAWAQIILTIIFVIGYFVVLSDFIHGRVSVPIEWKETLQGLLTLLTGALLQIVSYWFSRQRQSTDKTTGETP